MDNKKRLEVGAYMVLLAVWIFCLFIAVGTALNSGSIFRSVATLALAGINIWQIVKTWKDVQKKYRSLY